MTATVDLTPDVPARLKSDEAAQGARDLRLRAIDSFWSQYRDDLTAEFNAYWDSLHAEFWDRIRGLSGDVEVVDGQLYGNPLRWMLASRRIVEALDQFGFDLWQARLRHDMSMADALQSQEDERHPFAFTTAPPSEHRNEVGAA